MPQERLSDGRIMMAIAGYLVRSYRFHIASVMVVLLMVATGIMLWPSGEEEAARDDLLKQYASQHKKKKTPARKGRRTAPPASASSSSFSNWIQQDLPDKIRTEMAEFKVVRSVKVPEGMDPRMAEACMLPLLEQAHRALEEKAYDAALAYYDEALKEKSDNPYVGLYAWGGIMEICRRTGDKEGLDAALKRYSELLQQLGYSAAGEKEFDLLAMINNMGNFKDGLADYIGRADSVTANDKVDKNRLKTNMASFGHELEGLLSLGEPEESSE